MAHPDNIKREPSAGLTRITEQINRINEIGNKMNKEKIPQDRDEYVPAWGLVLTAKIDHLTSTVDTLASTVDTLTSTVDTLAIATARGFADVDKRFDHLAERMGRMERRQDLQQKILDDHDFRLHRIEKVAIN